MELNGTSRHFYDQDKDYSFRNTPTKSNLATATKPNVGADDYDIPDFMKRRTNKNARVRTNQDGDIAEFRKPPVRRQTPSKTQPPVRTQKPSQSKAPVTRNRMNEKQRKEIAREKVMKRAAALIMAASIAGGAHACTNEIRSYYPADANYDAAGQTISEVAEKEGVSSRAILLANQMRDSSHDVYEIVLPETFDPLAEEIEKLEYKYVHDKMTLYERDTLEAKINFLKDKQTEQDEIGETYTDAEGKFVYIIPDNLTRAEDIKDAYGIEDGVLRKYNNLEYDWGYDEEAPEHGSYRDYTDSHTMGVRVPMDEIGNFDKD